MISEEKLIKHLRNRKKRIICIVALILLISALAGLWWYVLQAVFEWALQSYDPQLGLAWCDGLHYGYLEALGLLLCAGLGALIALLIIELAGCNKDRLIVAMWDRISLLEQELGRPAPSHTVRAEHEQDD